LAKDGFSPRLGARPLQKLIEKRIVSPIAHFIVMEKVQKGETLLIRYDESTDTIEVERH
jgi:ATP-dependent Clp protease ATP-binding subunit ClpA